MPQTDTARTGTASPTRLRWWSELPLILVVYALYSAGRLLARGDTGDAVGNGLALLRAEKALGLNAEHPLNRLFAREPWLGIPADFWYASLHYLVTPALLVWLFLCRSAVYRAARTWLMTSTLIGLVGFVGFTLVPTCPPRLLDAAHGFVDTMARYSAYGWWGGEASAPRGLGGLTNQYAAMPSLHVGWSLWCGVVLWRYGGSRATRIAGVAYPLVTTVVVLGTANHYFLDAVAGAAVMGAGLLLTPLVTRLADRSGAVPRGPFGGRAGVPGAALAGAPGAPVAGASPDAPSPIVSGGCQTSAGERLPRQRESRAEPGAAPADAGDGTGAPAPAR
ncbi:inositol phosphorylceramide synthase [Streptomyces ruber]|uniref:Inositol phosphorylceramide synthase n=2 Tax=Streptomyces TaxID=1883 RepID=A0A918BBS8_9ACTN|nr:phosphatase PAP2 family protein [Streptomyces ruber]GGQ54721.1 inositol phosphorylceramide synthase [Streptomyces ruber]